MTVDKPTLHPMAARELAALRDAGATVTDEDVLWLDALAKNVTRTCDLAELSDWIEFPRICGPLTFVPLSIAAQEWLRLFASDWFDGDERMETLAVAYVLTHGRDPKAFELLTTEKAARRAIRRWAWSLPLSYTQIARAVDEYFSKSRVEVSKEPESSVADVRREWSFVMPWLVRYYGKDREHWLYRESAGVVHELVASLPSIIGGRSAEDAKQAKHAEFVAAVNYIKRGRVAA